MSHPNSSPSPINLSTKKVTDTPLTSASRIVSTRNLIALVALMAAAFMAATFANRAEAAITWNPAQCTDEISFDPGVPTPEEVFGTTLAPNTGGDNTSNNAAKKSSATLYSYLDALAAAAPELVIKKSAGSTALNRDIPYLVIASPNNITDLEDDAAFWRSVREGEVSPTVARRAIATRPAFAWISSNVHGDEASSGEATIKMMYELAARRDCTNYKRLTDLTSFLLPVQNPDGRDFYQRTNAWLFDLNRDWHTQEQAENYLKMGDALKYPSVVYVDAHQQGGSSFFFPPNEDPVHHEISDASINAINFTYGPALQKRFNDQNISYNNYSQYDLFTPEYGDTAPSLLLGAAGMTYEKGRGGSYAKQVYDHYLSLDETLNTTSREKTKILGAWINQWYEAIAQGANGELEPNQIVSPTHTISWQVPNEKVYGYYFLPNNHDGDVAKMLSVLQRAGVKVYELNEDTPVTGKHVFGNMNVIDPNAAGPERQTPIGEAGTLPEGTLYIPMAQSMKHWIQALLGEDGYVPYAYFYDVAGWSFSELKGMSGNGYMMENMPSGTDMSLIGAPDLGGAPATAQNYYAFNTDSSRALIMATKLAQADVKIWRTAQSFTSGGVYYPTGTALIDGTTVGAGVNLEEMSDEYQTPIIGLEALPAADRYEIKKPKLAIYTSGTSITLPPDGRCSGSTTFCQAYFTLTDKMGLNVTAITATQLAAGELATGNYTGFINPDTTIAAGAGATALQNWVNTGGNYFGFGAGGATAARNAGMTLINTTTNGPTGGVPVKVNFNTNSPLSWGFDNGGFLFRASGAVTFNPTTLAGNGSTIPAATESIQYPNPTLRFAYGTTISNLNGKTAAADQAYGLGNVSLLSVDPTFRAWLEGAERLIMNGVLYPTGDVITTPAAKRSAPASTAIPEDELPAVKNRPVKQFHDANTDIKISVNKTKAKVLKQAFRQSKAPAKVKKKAKFIRKGKKVTLLVKGARVKSGHPAAWTTRVLSKLSKKGIKPTAYQV